MPPPSSFRQTRLAFLRHGHPLPRDRVSILEPGRADVARRVPSRLRDRPGEVLRRQAALLDPQVEVIARPRRLVGRHFLNFEVLVAHPHLPAHARQVGGQ